MAMMTATEMPLMTVPATMAARIKDEEESSPSERDLRSWDDVDNVQIREDFPETWLWTQENLE